MEISEFLLYSVTSKVDNYVYHSTQCSPSVLVDCKLTVVMQIKGTISCDIEKKYCFLSMAPSGRVLMVLSTNISQKCFSSLCFSFFSTLIF